MTTIADLVLENALPVFPDTYVHQAKKVLQHAEKKRKRGKNPSMQFFGERNPRKALVLADDFLTSHKTVMVQRLTHLEDKLPDHDPLIYDFGKCIARNIGENVVPQQFILAATLSILELRTGTVIFDPTISNELKEILPLNQAYDKILLHTIPTIASTIFPPDFAQHVQHVLNNVLVLMGQSPAGPYNPYN